MKSMVIMGTTRTKALVVGLFALTACLLAGCSDSPAPTTKTKAAATSAPSPVVVPVVPVIPSIVLPTYAKCVELYVPGQVIDDAQAIRGCTDPDGTTVAGGWRRCDDGRHLINVDASSGAPAGWGFGGDVFHATTDLDTDPDWKVAYYACIGEAPPS